MNELTIGLLAVTILLYIVNFYLKRKEVDWLTLTVSVCAFCSILADVTVQDEQLILLIVPTVFVVFMSGLRVMDIVGGGK